MPPGAGRAPDEVAAGLARHGFALEEEIGRGGMSVVYRARDRKHEREVAVKVLRPEVAAGLGSERFLREIRVAAGLRHPNIVPLYDSGDAGGMLFYVMPLVEGESLRARLDRVGRLPVEEAVRIGREVAEALEYAHERGIVHRDIKPENVLLEAGHAVVADFGMALAVTRAAQERAAGESGSGERLTEIGVLVGTPAYMSPEQASGEVALDGRSDIYSLGCVLYEMLAGDPPFTGPTTRAVLARRFRGPPAPLSELRPEVPPALVAAIARAMEEDPNRRFPTGAALAAALEAAGLEAAAASGDPPGAAGTAGFRAEAGVGAARGRWRFAGAGLSALGVIAVVGMLATLGTRAPARPRAPLDPHRVAVAALSNETGDSSLAPLGHLVAAWITDRLTRTAGVEVVTSAIVVPAQHDTHRTGDSLDDPERLHRLAVETRAGTLVSGSYYRGAGGLEFHIEITDANSGRLLAAIGPVSGAGSPERTADELSRAVVAAVDSLVPGETRAGRPGRARG